MKNNYLLECRDSVVLLAKIEELIQTANFTNASRSVYDLEEKDLSDALEDLDTYNFLTDQKVVIIQNAFSNISEEKFEHLLKYVENFNENNLLILTTKKLDSRLNVVKKIKKSKNISLLTLEINAFSYIKNRLKDYQISNEAVSLLIEKCQEDITKIENECNKLMIFKINTMQITKEDVENLVVKKLGDSNEHLFSFVRHLLMKNKKNALETYQELLSYQIDQSSIIGLITQQLRLIYQVKLLASENLNHDQITEKLALKSSYQVKKMKEYSYYYTYQELKELIHSVANLDYKIKSGKVDSSYALDLFILNLS